MCFNEETNRTLIKCPKCGSYDVDVIEADRGCENPVMSMSIICNKCMWEKIYYEDANCIPIPEELMKQILMESCFELQISTEEFIYSLVAEYFRKQKED